jgi:hypothetical protein
MLRSGDWVEVRSKREILETLDSRGTLDNMPFMTEMLEYCGQRFQVLKSAHKTCDTVTGRYVGLSLKDGVHLGTRCSGEHHGGCQAGCLIFWKEAWLKPSDGPVEHRNSESAGNLEDILLRAAKRVTAKGETIYSCQATELLSYTRPLKWWDARQYINAYTTKNVSGLDLLRGLTFLAYCYGTGSHTSRFGVPGRWLYNKLRPLWGGLPFPRMKGKIPVGALTPRRDLDLKPGDLVQIRPFEEILSTLDESGSNRGLTVDAELAPYCGRTYRVKGSVERFVDEKTGKLRTLKTPAVILDGVVCKAKFSGQRTFCPREIYLWCREIWLNKVTDGNISKAEENAASVAESSKKDELLTQKAVAPLCTVRSSA